MQWAKWLNLRSIVLKTIFWSLVSTLVLRLWKASADENFGVTSCRVTSLWCQASCLEHTGTLNLLQAKTYILIVTITNRLLVLSYRKLIFLGQWCSRPNTDDVSKVKTKTVKGTWIKVLLVIAIYSSPVRINILAWNIWCSWIRQKRTFQYKAWINQRVTI